MIEIIHISDTHLKSDARHPHNIRLERALAHIAGKHPKALLVASGDICDNGRRDEFLQAYKLFSKLDNPKLIVKGNHDKDIKGIWPARVLRRFCKKTGIRCPLGSWPWMNKPFCMQSEGGKLLLIGLDSNDDRFGAEGKIGKRQLKWLARNLKRPAQHRIVALHHHPWERDFLCKLKDAEQFLQTVSSANLDMLFFGHRHKPGLWRDRYGIKIISAAGALYDETNYRLFRIHNDGRIDFELEKYR